MSPSTCSRARYSLVSDVGAKPSRPRWPRRKLTSLAPAASSAAGHGVERCRRSSSGTGSAAHTLAAPKSACSVAVEAGRGGARRVAAGVAHLRLPGEVGEVVASLPPRNSRILRSSQARSCARRAAPCADQITGGSMRAGGDVDLAAPARRLSTSAWCSSPSRSKLLPDTGSRLDVPPPLEAPAAPSIPASASASPAITEVGLAGAEVRAPAVRPRHARSRRSTSGCCSCGLV